MRSLAAALALCVTPLCLAGCGSRDEVPSITVKDERGKTVAGANGDSGQVELDVPGFEGNITLPKIKLDADSLDLNGVHLYPGSTVNDFNIRAGEGKGGVRVAFTSPAEPATVRDWLAERLNKTDFAVRREGNGLVGTTDEKQRFRLTLEPADDHHARGVLTIG